MTFNFYDAHDIKPLTARACEETVKAVLRQRFANAKQVLVLIGQNTKYLYRFVRWEIEIAQKLDVPIIVVNLNGRREMDSERCPPILRDSVTAHVAFKARIIQHALDYFPDEYRRVRASASGYRYYGNDVYTSLGI